MEVTFLSTESYSSPCSECKAASIPISLENMMKYFAKVEICCPKCNSKLDWWNTLLRHFDWGHYPYLVSLIGGFTSSFSIKMKINETFLIDLDAINIPSDAKIIVIGYTPNGSGLLPIEIHGNVPFRHTIPHKIRLYGMRFGVESEMLPDDTEVPVSIMVCWMPKIESGEAISNLIRSIENFAISEYESCIIPANVTVESTLSKLLNQYISNSASKDRVEDMLSSGATYSHQLNVLLPLVAKFENFPIFPDHIRGILNKLRKVRNSLAHEGHINPALSKDKVSEYICASMFGLSYLHLLKLKLKGVI